MRFLHEFWSQSRGKRKPHVLWSGSYPVDLPTGPAIGTDWLANCQKNLAKYGKVPAIDRYCIHEDWQCSYPLHTMVTGIRHSNSVRADIANALM